MEREEKEGKGKGGLAKEGGDGEGGMVGRWSEHALRPPLAPARRVDSPRFPSSSRRLRTRTQPSRRPHATASDDAQEHRRTAEPPSTHTPERPRYLMRTR